MGHYLIEIESAVKRLIREKKWNEVEQVIGKLNTLTQKCIDLLADEKNNVQNEHCPKVTIVMPVYNGEKYLREAIESILNQSFRNFEFLIIDDGSKDKSIDVIKSYKDSRIILLCNKRNLGLVTTLNKGIRQASGLYIARMDCDDISHEERLMRQVQYMDNNPHVGMCGTFMVTMGGRESQIWKYPIDVAVAKCMLLFNTVAGHPTVMMRRSVLETNNLLYSDQYRHAEDYALWLDFARVSHISNLDSVLLKYRISEGQVSQRHRKQQIESHIKVQKKALFMLGIEPSDEELQLHAAISLGRNIADLRYIESVSKWLFRLQEANFEKKYYPQTAFANVLRYFWKRTCGIAEPVLGAVIRTYWQQGDLILKTKGSCD